MDFKIKYLKYKNKYINLKNELKMENQYGGEIGDGKVPSTTPYSQSWLFMPLLLAPFENIIVDFSSEIIVASEYVKKEHNLLNLAEIIECIQNYYLIKEREMNAQKVSSEQTESIGQKVSSEQKESGGQKVSSEQKESGGQKVSNEQTEAGGQKVSSEQTEAGGQTDNKEAKKCKELENDGPFLSNSMNLKKLGFIFDTESCKHLKPEHQNNLIEDIKVVCPNIEASIFMLTYHLLENYKGANFKFINIHTDLKSK